MDLTATPGAETAYCVPGKCMKYAGYIRDIQDLNPKQAEDVNFSNGE